MLQGVSAVDFYFTTLEPVLCGGGNQVSLPWLRQNHPSLGGSPAGRTAPLGVCWSCPARSQNPNSPALQTNQDDQSPQITCSLHPAPYWNTSSAPKCEYSSGIEELFCRGWTPEQCKFGTSSQIQLRSHQFWEGTPLSPHTWPAKCMLPQHQPTNIPLQKSRKNNVTLSLHYISLNDKSQKSTTLGTLGRAERGHLGSNPMPANPNPSSLPTIFTCNNTTTWNTPTWK